MLGFCLCGSLMRGQGMRFDHDRFSANEGINDCVSHSRIHTLSDSS